MTQTDQINRRFTRALNTPIRNDLLNAIRNTGWNAISRLPLAFEDLKGLERPEWWDVSRFQGAVDYAVAKAFGVQGVYIRSTVSWGYQDAWFPGNWAGAGDHGLYRSSYHVLYPSESAVRQADNWFRVHPVLETIPRVIDAELQHDSSNEQVADRLWELSEVVLSRDGFRPIIYGRAGQLDPWLYYWSDEMKNDHFYFLAQYLYDRVREHPGPVLRPKGVREDRVLLHQTGDRKPSPPGATESPTVDRNRWELGNVDQQNDFIAVTWGGAVPDPDPEPPIPLPIDCTEEVIQELLKTQDEINHMIDQRIVNLRE